MGDAQYRLFRLRDELTFQIASTRAGQLDGMTLEAMFDQYQGIWDVLSICWLEARRSSPLGQ